MGCIPDRARCRQSISDARHGNPAPLCKLILRSFLIAGRERRSCFNFDTDATRQRLDSLIGRSCACLRAGRAHKTRLHRHRRAVRRPLRRKQQSGGWGRRVGADRSHFAGIRLADRFRLTADQIADAVAAAQSGQRCSASRARSSRGMSVPAPARAGHAPKRMGRASAAGQSSPRTSAAKQSSAATKASRSAASPAATTSIRARFQG